MTYLVDANVLSEPTKQAPSSKVMMPPPDTLAERSLREIASSRRDRLPSAGTKRC